MSVQTLIQIRRGLSTLWTSTNPTLNSGEWGYETDTGRYKIGDGITVWTSLDYSAITPDSYIAGSGIGLNTGSLGSTLTVSVTGIPSSLVTDFNTAVNSLITSASIDIETIQDIIGNSGVAGGFGTSASYNDTTGYTTIAATGLTLRVVSGSGISVSSSSENNNNIYTVSLSDPTIQAADVTDFASAVSGLLPSISSGTNTNVVFSGNNYTINVTGVSLTGHTHTWSNITDASAIATTGELNYLGGVTPGTGSAGKVVVLDSNKDITGIRNLTSEGNVTVGGNLIVNGTTTTVNSTTVDIGDNIIRVNTSGLTTGGFEVYDGASTKSLLWDNSDNRWEFSGGDVYTSGNIIANNLQIGSSGLVTNLNADYLDGQSGSYYTDFNNLTNIPDPVISGVLTGDLSGSGSTTLTNLGNGTININADIVAGSIVNADISSSAGIAVTKLASSGVTLGSTVINLGQTSSVIDGLTRISGVNSSNPVYIHYAVIDGGTP